MAAVLVVVVAFGCGGVHHAEHGGAAGAEEAPEEDGGDGEEEEVEDGGVVPADAFGHDLRVAVLRDEVEGAEEELDGEGGEGHGGVEGPEQDRGDFEAVVLAVDVEDGKDDEVGEEEGDDATEGDATVPEDGREGNVADRADEGEDGDERADEGSPELCCGTQAARQPEMSRPPAMSGQSEYQSIQK